MSSSRRRTSARYSFNRSHHTVSPVRSPASGIESARDLLSQALDDVEAVTNYVVEKTNSGYSQTAALNAMASGSAYVPDLDDDLLGTNVTIKSEPDDYSDADSPLPKQRRYRYRSARRARKRKVAEDPPPSPPAPSPYTVKLFDRSVDLSSFDQRTPLYVLCRAWVRNPTLADANDEEEAQNEFQTNSTCADIADNQDVHELPAPLPSDRDVRIPLSVQKPTATAADIDAAINSLSDKTPQDLIAQNRQRWKAIRQDWLKAAAQNELRYKPSLDVLKSIYER